MEWRDSQHVESATDWPTRKYASVMSYLRVSLVVSLRLNNAPSFDGSALQWLSFRRSFDVQPQSCRGGERSDDKSGQSERAQDRKWCSERHWAGHCGIGGSNAENQDRHCQG